jgi:hypothetical protein
MVSDPVDVPVPGPIPVPKPDVVYTHSSSGSDIRLDSSSIFSDRNQNGGFNWPNQTG